LTVPRSGWPARFVPRLFNALFEEEKKKEKKKKESRKEERWTALLPPAPGPERPERSFSTMIL